MNAIKMVSCAVVASVVGLAGCQGGPSGSARGEGASVKAPKMANGEQPIVQTGITEADRAFAASKEPLTSDGARLYVNGMGCPLCASALDLQLKRVQGVDAATVDLSKGQVDVALSGKSRPSPQRLADAVADAGFTLVKVEPR